MDTLPIVIQKRTGRARLIRRKPRTVKLDPVANILRIVGGAILGIVLSTLLLWWVFDNDSFKLGPMVTQVFPEIVPEHFQK